ncbi:hypothetical protein ACFX2I_011026 [Malus domestica]
MTDEYSEDNLISKTERFLSQSVLKSFKESLRALKSCERVALVADNLGFFLVCGLINFCGLIVVEDDGGWVCVLGRARDVRRW